MIKILIAEDEERMRDILKEYLSFEGYDYEEAKDGEEAISMFNKDKYSLVLLDVMMPRVDGWGVLREIRKTSDVPVIMITARGEEYDRLFGFELGVDDYIIKPFSPKEVMARLKAVIRRTEQKEKYEDILEFEGLRIDFLSRSVHVNDELKKLTPKEFDLLAFLVKNKNIALTRQQILDGVWGIDFFGDDRTVDTHIKMLRESLKEVKHMISTVWGIGYKFELGEKR